MIYTYIVKIKIQAKEVYLTLSVGLRIGVRCMRLVFFCLAGKHFFMSLCKYKSHNNNNNNNNDNNSNNSKYKIIHSKVN